MMDNLVNEINLLGLVLEGDLEDILYTLHKSVPEVKIVNRWGFMYM